MRRALVVLAVLVLIALAAGAIVWKDSVPPAGTPLHRAGGQGFAKIERGHELVIAADCASCHDAPGGEGAMAGGRLIETPFGKVAAPNITPDRDTGIGAWSDAAFDAALRQGRRRDGKRLYPAMPFVYYARMSRDDVLAIRAYLDTVQPVPHQVIADQLPFPFDIRASMIAWDELYFRSGEFKPDPSKPTAWNRGAFLVNGPAHCGACHTPKSLLGGDETSKAFQGSLVQGWFAPDITNDERTGLGRWSTDDIGVYLKTGHNRFSAATGPMAEEVMVSSAHMSNADLRAIATYLKSLPGHRAAPAAAVPHAAMTAGAHIYRQACSACHGGDGRGVGKLFPSLAGSAMLQSENPTSLMRIVLRGARSAATDQEPTAPTMPAFGWQLDDKKVAEVLTYVRNSFGNKAANVTATDVRTERSKLALRND